MVAFFDVQITYQHISTGFCPDKKIANFEGFRKQSDNFTYIYLVHNM